MKTGFKVIDTMRRKVVCATPETDVLECSRLMRDERVGSLLIKQKDKLVGIITLEDVVRQVVAMGKDPSKVHVKDVMATKLITIEPEKDLYDVMVKMKNTDVRHIPVIDSGKLIGIITLKDVLNVEPQIFDYIAEKLHTCEERKGFTEGNVKE